MSARGIENASADSIRPSRLRGLSEQYPPASVRRLWDSIQLGIIRRNGILYIAAWSSRCLG
jgi:hypothetical protein